MQTVIADAIVVLQGSDLLCTLVMFSAAQVWALKDSFREGMGRSEWLI